MPIVGMGLGISTCSQCARQKRCYFRTALQRYYIKKLKPRKKAASNFLISFSLNIR